MTFLAEMTSKTLLKLQKSQLSHKLNIYTMQMNGIKRNMTTMDRGWDDDIMGDIEDNEYYRWLQDQDTFFELQIEKINEQTSLLDNEIQALETLVKSGIKSSCSLTLLGGS